jgi:hypothetical protein
LGFIEQKRELQEAVCEQPKPLAYDTPADVVRNIVFIYQHEVPINSGFGRTAGQKLGVQLP